MTKRQRDGEIETENTTLQVPTYENQLYIGRDVLHSIRT